MKNKTILRSFSSRTALFVSIMLALIYSASSLAITLYKWVDAEGNISYQDQPPAGGQKYEEKSFSSEGARTGDTNAEIARLRAIQENPVMLYLAENCDSCDLVGRILESNNVPYDITQVGGDAEAQKILLDLIGSLRVPTLTVGEIIIEGSNRATIEDTLRRSGYPQVQSDAIPQ